MYQPPKNITKKKITKNMRNLPLLNSIITQNYRQITHKSWNTTKKRFENHQKRSENLQNPSFFSMKSHEKAWKSIRTFTKIPRKSIQKHQFFLSESPQKNGADHGLSPATDPEPAELPKPLRSAEPAEPAERQRRAQVLGCNVGPHDRWFMMIYLLEMVIFHGYVK